MRPPPCSPVYLTGHYIRQEDFDQPPSDDEYGSDFDDEDDYDDEELSGLIGHSDEEDEDMEDRIQEIQEPVKACVLALTALHNPLVA